MIPDLFNQLSETSGYGKSYHNRNDESGARLQESEEKARSLEQVILTKLIPAELYTPWQVYELLSRKNLIGSVRRALSNLTKKGLLIKTKEKVIEVANAQNFYWRLATEEEKLRVIKNNLDNIGGTNDL